FTPSPSNTVSQQVTTPAQIATTTHLSSAPNPSTPGQTVSFVALVTPASGSALPAGQVTFTVDGMARPPVDLQVINGLAVAILTDSTLPAGSHTASAVYGGNPNFSASPPSNTVTQVVAAALTPTMTKLTSNPNFPSPGTPGLITTALQAVVTPTSGAGTPARMVTLSVDGQAMSPVSLSSGTALLPLPAQLTAGSHTFTATYSGDPTFATSSDTLTVTVNPYPATVSLSASPNPSSQGQTVTFFASVTPVVF